MHGPTSIMCTQLLSPKAVEAEIRANQESNCGGGCLSCSLSFPRVGQSGSDTSGAIGCMRSKGPTSEVVFLSSASPASEAKFKVIRQLCFRGLSTENTFNDSTPMMFTDPSLGSVMMMNFTVVDEMARGGQRRYGLMVISEAEGPILNSWSFITQKLRLIIKNIQTKADTARDNKSTALEESTNARFLRSPRDHMHAPRCLSDIVEDDKIFVDLHVRFSRLLYGIYKDMV